MESRKLIVVVVETVEVCVHLILLLLERRQNVLTHRRVK